MEYGRVVWNANRLTLSMERLVVKESCPSKQLCDVEAFILLFLLTPG